MTEDNELYTDYALQLFSSYLIEDMASMEMILHSFKEDGKNEDGLFLPGLIYGLMYHMGTIMRLVSHGTGVELEKLLSDYAMDYAVAREDLLDNPLLNVNKAREVMDQIMQSIDEINRMIEEEDF
jgi:hypothetical protein